MELENILSELEALVINARRVPFSNKRVIEEDDLADIIDTLKQAVPAEIKKSKQIILERDKILEKARIEGDEHISRTKEYSRTVIEKEEIYEQAKREAAELKRIAFENSSQTLEKAQLEAADILNAAEEQSEKIKEEAHIYVMELLDYVQNVVGQAQANTQNVIEAIQETRINIKI